MIPTIYLVLSISAISAAIGALMIVHIYRANPSMHKEK